MGKIKTILGVVVVLFILSSVLSYFLNTDLGDTIVIIPVHGTLISLDSGSFLMGKTQTAGDLIQLLKDAEQQDAVKGIILDINSPGGTVLASKEIADTVQSLQKPVVAWIREIGTSGAYWVASASDAIVADELSLTGSIGVVSSFLEFSDLFEDYGITYEGLKTGKYKDIGSPFKHMTDEERDLLLGKMQVVHDHFVRVVSENRNLPEQDVRELATGIYYLGTEAYDMGLVDYLGGKDLAVNVTKELAQITDAKIKMLETKKTFLDVIGQLSSQAFFFMGKGVGDVLGTVDVKTRPELFA